MSESAFPNAGAHANNVPEGGLTKRELFAAMAMQGFITADDYQHIALSSGRPSNTTMELHMAVAAVKCADALISALEARKALLEWADKAHALLVAIGTFEDISEERSAEISELLGEAEDL